MLLFWVDSRACRVPISMCLFGFRAWYWPVRGAWYDGTSGLADPITRIPRGGGHDGAPLRSPDSPHALLGREATDDSEGRGRWTSFPLPLICNPCGT